VSKETYMPVRWQVTQTCQGKRGLSVIKRDLVLPYKRPFETDKRPIETGKVSEAGYTLFIV